MNRSVLRGVAAAALSLLALLALPAFSASAHSQLDSSTPAANSVVSTAPTSIVLDFNEGIQASLADVRLYDSKGKRITLGSPHAGANDSIVTVSVPSIGTGLFAVIWRVTSADGHPVDGAFSFQVGTATTANGQALIEQVRGNTKGSSSVAWFYGLMRFLVALGQDVEIVVGPAVAKRKLGAQITVATRS